MVDVIYQGLPIARAAGLRVEGGALFVEMDAPMPVATALTLAYEGKKLSGRVQRIHEGVGAGVFFAPDGALPSWVHAVRAGGQTLELEAEPESPPLAVSAPSAETLPPILPPEPAASVQVVPEPAQAAPEPAQAAPEPAQAAPEPALGVVPENTQEMFIPSLDDEPKEADVEAPTSDRRPPPSSKKKKPGRRR